MLPIRRSHYFHPMTRSTVLAAFALATSLASAQNATISRFRFWTADTAFSIWTDTSTVFVYKAPDGSKATVPTADTLYKYTVAKLNKRLDITLEALNVDGSEKGDGKERLTGFPDRKTKTVLADGKFGMVVEVEVVVSAIFRKSENPRKKTPDRFIGMKVTVETFDGAGKRTSKYMEHTEAKDLKQKQNWLPGYEPEVGLTGNQVMALYTEALENALNTKR